MAWTVDRFLPVLGDCRDYRGSGLRGRTSIDQDETHTLGPGGPQGFFVGGLFAGRSV
jgi:hypothetical protein